MTIVDAATQSLSTLLEPRLLLFILLGVVLGLAIGIIPGLGGAAGLALLIPFLIGMEPAHALGMMIALLSVTSTSDTLPAVLFGVPGTAAAQATIMDGHVLARQGQAGRALGASYASSFFGGLVGAIAILACAMVLRPIVLAIGAPELLAFGILGLTMVAVLAGKRPLKGLAAAVLGLSLGFIGVHVQSGFLRWTGGTLYLYDGLSITIVALGIFALPEIWDMFIQGTKIADVPATAIKGVREGIRDWRRNMRLSAESGALGTVIGIVPGVGGSVSGWLTYGYAKQTRKGAHETFGTGDIRGVIAPESANNSTDAGSLLPTLIFGVPGSASMAIILAAMIMFGIQPGPDMLGPGLSTTLTLVWIIPIANLLGAAIMIALTPQFAKLATVRVSMLAPLMIVIVFLASYQTTRSWGDIIALLLLTLLGFVMKRTGWPRPPLLLGFVLAPILEKYFFISTGAYGTFGWLTHPVVIVTLSLGAISVAATYRALGRLR